MQALACHFLCRASLWRSIFIYRPYAIHTLPAAESQQRYATWWASLESLLQRVAPWVEEAQVHSNGDIPSSSCSPNGQLAQLLRLLQPGMLSSLRLNHAAWDDEPPRLVTAALQRLTSLHTLHVVWHDLPACSAEAFVGLRQLGSLHLEAWPVPAPVVRAIAQLAALTDLRLCSTGSELPFQTGEVLALGRLSQLRHLGLASGTGESAMEAPAVLMLRPASFPQLRSFSLGRCEVSVQAVVAPRALAGRLPCPVRWGCVDVLSTRCTVHMLPACL